MSMAQLLRILLARHRMVLLIFSIVVVTTAVVSKLSPKMYTATATLIVDFAGMDPITGAVINAQQLLPTYMATQVDVIGSHKVALRVVDSNNLTADPDYQADFEKSVKGKGSFRDWLADQLLENLDVSPSRQSNTIEVSYSAKTGDLAAKFANAFTQSYVDTNLDLRTGPARQTSLWFEEQIKGLRDDVASAQARLSAVEKEQGIVSVGAEHLDIEKSRLAELGNELVHAQKEAAEAVAHQKHFAEVKAKGRSFDSLPEVTSNLLVQKLKENLGAAEAKLADTGERVAKSHPMYQRALAEVASLRERLKAEIDYIATGINNQAQIALQHEAELRTRLAAEKTTVLDLSNQRSEVAVLLREVENAQEAYDAAMKRFSETRLESEASQTNIAILNPAVSPIYHSRPKVKMNIALAILFGGALSIGAALVAEMMDRRVRGVEDLELALDLPVLGILPGPGQGRLERETTKSLPWLGPE